MIDPNPTFSCPACATRFALKPQVAGRKIACRCGKIFVAPGMPEPAGEANPYDLVQTWEESEPPKAAQASSHTAPHTAPALKKQSLASTAVPSNAAFAAYPRRKSVVTTDDDSAAEFSPLRDRIIPIALLVIGIGLRIAQIPFDRSLAGGSIGASLALSLCQMIVTAAIMLAGVLIASRILGANFGDLGSVILKLCAIAVFEWAVGAFSLAITHYSADAGRIMFGLILIVNFIVFTTMFTLDLQESMATVAICSFLQSLAALAFFLQH